MCPGHVRRMLGIINYMYVLNLARRQPHLHVSAAYIVQSTGKGMVLKDAETS